MNKVAQFEKVSFDQFKKCYEDSIFINDEEIEAMYNNIQIPKRKTKYSAGHDIAIPCDTRLKPGMTLKIPTGLRCKMENDYVMLIFPRSSLGINHGLTILNTIPVIDSDYYNADNEGHIKLAIKNNGDKDLVLRAGDNIVQAVFVKYGVADDEEVTTKRTGGIGSTTESKE